MQKRDGIFRQFLGSEAATERRSQKKPSSQSQWTCRLASESSRRQTDSLISETAASLNGLQATTYKSARSICSWLEDAYLLHLPAKQGNDDLIRIREREIADAKRRQGHPLRDNTPARNASDRRRRLARPGLPRPESTANIPLPTCSRRVAHRGEMPRDPPRAS